jgi:hypothetical protein
MLVPPCEDDDHGKARLRQEPWPETNSTLLAFVIRATPIFLFGQQGHLIHVSASARTEMRTKAITWVDSEKESGKFHSHSSIQPSTIRSGCLEEGADGRMWGKTQRAASDKFAIDRVHDRHCACEHLGDRNRGCLRFLPSAPTKPLSPLDSIGDGFIFHPLAKTVDPPRGTQ